MVTVPSRVVFNRNVIKKTQRKKKYADTCKANFPADKMNRRIHGKSHRGVTGGPLINKMHSFHGQVVVSLPYQINDVGQTGKLFLRVYKYVCMYLDVCVPFYGMYICTTIISVHDVCMNTFQV